jgi:hypothetical protein
MPQPPQLAGSVLVLVQAPLQLVNPAVHSHAPAEHCWPNGQATPQLPQWFGSVCVLTHWLLQLEKPA